jgi:hypothetical protein
VTLIPVVMVLTRLLESQLYITPLAVFIGVVCLWVLMRLLKGISIIYDVLSFKVYVMGLVILLIVGVALYGYADYARSTTVYLKYLLHTSAQASER